MFTWFGMLLKNGGFSLKNALFHSLQNKQFFVHWVGNWCEAKGSKRWDIFCGFPSCVNHTCLALCLTLHTWPTRSMLHKNKPPVLQARWYDLCDIEVNWFTWSANCFLLTSLNTADSFIHWFHKPWPSIPMVKTSGIPATEQKMFMFTWLWMPLEKGGSWRCLIG